MRAGRTIADIVTSRAEPRLNPDSGRLVMVDRNAREMNNEMTSGDGGKPILLMKLKAFTVPVTPLDCLSGGPMSQARPMAATIFAT